MRGKKAKMAEWSNATVSSTVITRGSNPFLGICGVKSCFNRKNQITNNGLPSKSPLTFYSKKDSFVVSLLRSHYVTVESKCTPFCCGNLDLTSKYKGLYIGASSNGAVLNLVNKKTDIELTTDTGGSTIVPSARAKLIGFKPSYGRISRDGLVPLCSYLDVVSLMSNKFDQIINAYKVLDLYDQNDSTCFNNTERKNTEVKKIKIASNFFNSEDLLGIKKIFPEAVCGPIEIPPKEVLDGCYHYILCPDFYSNMNRFDGVQQEDRPSDIKLRFDNTDIADIRSTCLNTQIKSRILIGSSILHKKYDPLKLLYLFKKKYSSIFENTFWIFPAAQNLYSNDSEVHSTHYSVFLNLCKGPIITIPSQTSNGIQIAGPVNSDLQLLDLCSKRSTI